MSECKMCEWEIAFRRQVAKDGHTIETLEQENIMLEEENRQLKRKFEFLEFTGDRGKE